jgi:hypothetical protein
MKRYILTFFAIVLLSACGQNKSAKFAPLAFPEVVPPGMMSDPQDRADWLAQNYWNKLADPERTYPCDSTLVSGVRKDDVEQRFANWVSVLEMVHHSTALKAVNALCDKVLSCETKSPDSNVLETMTELMEKYLYDANSPYRNEDYYGAYVVRLAVWDGISPELRGKYAFQVERTSKNKVGTVAEDFRFSDKTGKIRTLHGIKAPMTLLFFSNPGCDACMNIINVLKGEPRISQMIASGQLAVLNIYIDEDLEAWRSYMPIYPDECYNGFDPDFITRNQELYNVRAVPSLYLLDAEKKVMLKDAPENKVFDYLVKLQ